MSIKYEVLKKLVVAAGLKKRWLSATTEELLENRRKQNAKNRIPALKDRERSQGGLGDDGAADEGGNAG
ncbi:MAG: hypothetical protein IKE24_06215 [Clostridia bacterium]|nr:hypothetical protein [Clostridia bacterium]